MADIFDFANIIVDLDNRRTEYYGVLDVPDFPIKGMIKDVIRSDEWYRPDKVAFRLYGDASLSWVIDEVNNWTLKDYKIGAEFQYPTESTLQVLRIL